MISTKPFLFFFFALLCVCVYIYLLFCRHNNHIQFSLSFLNILWFGFWILLLFNGQITNTHLHWTKWRNKKKHMYSNVNEVKSRSLSHARQSSMIKTLILFNTRHQKNKFVINLHVNQIIDWVQDCSIKLEYQSIRGGLVTKYGLFSFFSF